MDSDIERNIQAPTFFFKISEKKISYSQEDPEENICFLLISQFQDILMRLEEEPIERCVQCLDINHLSEREEYILLNAIAI